jgi:hypothetical protein
MRKRSRPAMQTNTPDLCHLSENNGIEVNFPNKTKLRESHNK